MLPLLLNHEFDFHLEVFFSLVMSLCLLSFDMSSYVWFLVIGCN